MKLINAKITDLKIKEWSIKKPLNLNKDQKSKSLAFLNI